MMKTAVGILFHVQGDYFQCSTVSKILMLEHSSEAHFKHADKDKRICDNEAYTPPKKVSHSHRSVNSTLSRNVTLCNKTICGGL